MWIEPSRQRRSLLTRSIALVVVSGVPSGVTSAPVSVLDYMEPEARERVLVNAEPRSPHDDAIEAAFASSNQVVFPAGTYWMTRGVTKAADDVDVDFGDARILFEPPSAGYAFTFGRRADRPVLRGLHVRGGRFERRNPTSPINANFLRIAGMREFSLDRVSCRHAANGGVLVEAGCEDGIISDLVISGRSSHPISRGLWINGSTASDFVPQLVDLETLSRNDIPTPRFAARRIRIVRPQIILPGYGIYLMNTRDCRIEDAAIDISGDGSARCIAINNYSPGTVVEGGTMRSDRSSTGILVTQCSTGVRINGVRFRGSFGGNRDIYVQYLAEAQITRCDFDTDSTQQLQIDMGGQADVRNNRFDGSYANGKRVIRLQTIDASLVGREGVGTRATMLPGLVFQDNEIHHKGILVSIDTPTAVNGNVPGIKVVVVRGNRSYDWDLATGGGERGISMQANGTQYPVELDYGENVAQPARFSSRGNGLLVRGEGYRLKSGPR